MTSYVQDDFRALLVTDPRSSENVNVTRPEDQGSAVVQHPLLNYSFYISRMPVITTDPRSISLRPSGNCLPVHQGLPLIRWEIDQGSVLVANGRSFQYASLPAQTLEFRDPEYSPEMSRRPILVLIPDPITPATYDLHLQ